MAGAAIGLGAAAMIRHKRRKAAKRRKKAQQNSGVGKAIGLTGAAPKMAAPVAVPAKPIA